MSSMRLASGPASPPPRRLRRPDRSPRRCRSRRTAGSAGGRPPNLPKRSAMAHSPSPAARSSPPARRSARGRTARVPRWWPEPRRSACRRPRHSGAARPRARAHSLQGSGRRDVGGQVHDVGQFGTTGRRGVPPEQKGASARATDATAFSCSSRSLLDRDSAAASARSPIRSPVRRMVPARMREVARPASRRTSISGVAPMKPSMEYVQHRVYRAASAAANHRGSISLSANASRSRASTTLSSLLRLIRRTASATAASHSGPVRAPSEKVTFRGPIGAPAGGRARSAWGSVPMRVSHVDRARVRARLPE